jgi:hypothetical protein
MPTLRGHAGQLLTVRMPPMHGHDTQPGSGCCPGGMNRGVRRHLGQLPPQQAEVSRAEVLNLQSAGVRQLRPGSLIAVRALDAASRSANRGLPTGWIPILTLSELVWIGILPHSLGVAGLALGNWRSARTRPAVSTASVTRSNQRAATFRDIRFPSTQ